MREGKKMKKMREERRERVSEIYDCGVEVWPGGSMAAWRVLQCGCLAGGERENEMRRGRMK